MNHNQLRIHNYTAPDWKPLERAVNIYGVKCGAVVDSVLNQFMWMCEEPEGLHQYKHRDTRNYANLRIDSSEAECIAELEKAIGFERTWGKVLDERLGK